MKKSRIEQGNPRITSYMNLSTPSTKIMGGSTRWDSLIRNVLRMSEALTPLTRYRLGWTAPHTSCEVLRYVAEQPASCDP